MANFGDPMADGLAPIRAFIAAQDAAGAEVTWVGIGASTNLAALLVSHPAPGAAGLARAFAMFGQSPENDQDVETNVRLDPAATRAVVAECAARALPLTVVTLDTTGFGLTWHHPVGGANVHVPDVGALLRARLPAVWAAVEANTKSAAAGDYSGSSALHDPLTVCLAIDDTWAPTLLAPARIGFAPAAGAGRAHGLVTEIAVGAVTLAARQALAASTVEPKFWSTFGPTYRKLEPEASANCIVTLGPLTVAERGSFIERLCALLSL